MNCPTCKQAMIVLEVDQIEVDYCTVCQGIWLDAGELELLLENGPQADRLIKSFAAADTDEQKRKCPICHHKMDKVQAGSAQGRMEVIDRCPKQHGLWFDRGELQKVLEMGRFDEECKVQRLLKDLFRSE